MHKAIRTDDKVVINFSCYYFIIMNQYKEEKSRLSLIRTENIFKKMLELMKGDGTTFETVSIPDFRRGNSNRRPSPGRRRGDFHFECPSVREGGGRGLF